MAFRSDSRNRRFGGDRFSGRSDGRSGGFNRGGFGERREGGFGGDRGNRRPLEMHEVTCDKCGKQCEVPFKPTGDKPVLCSSCFRKDGDSGSNFRSRGGNFSSRENSSSSGMSKEQFTELNTKLDKILKILETVEFEDADEDGEEDEGTEEDADEEESEEAVKKIG